MDELDPPENTLISGANVVGFVLGVDGARYFGQELVSSWTGRYVLRVPVVATADRDTRVYEFDFCLVLVRACSSAYNSYLSQVRDPVGRCGYR